MKIKQASKGTNEAWSGKKKGGEGGEIKKMEFSVPGRAVPPWWFWKPLEALWDVANSLPQ